MRPPLSPLGRGIESAEEPEAAAFEWTRSNALALALYNCSACHGAGMRLQRKKMLPCNCVLRGAFRICMSKYRQILVDQEGIRTGAVFQSVASRAMTAGTATSHGHSRRRPFAWSRPQEEFVADVEIVARRTLSGNEMKLFSMHHVGGLHYTICCPVLKVNRGDFFHMVYRVEQKLGRAFAETRPYALYPTAEYFHPVMRCAEKPIRAASVSLPKTEVLGRADPIEEAEPQCQPATGTDEGECAYALVAAA